MCGLPPVGQVPGWWSHSDLEGADVGSAVPGFPAPLPWLLSAEGGGAC